MRPKPTRRPKPTKPAKPIRSTGPNPLLPAPRPADVAAIQYQREREREAIEHDRAVVLYAAERGVEAFHAHAFFAEDQRAVRTLAYIRAHPGVSAAEADRIVAAGDAGR